MRIVALTAALTAAFAFAGPLPTEAAQHSSKVTICIFNHALLKSPANTCRPEARKYPRRVKGATKRAIYDGALTFGVPYSILLQIARCESGLNLYASNGSHLGLFQFAPATFQLGSHVMKSLTGIAASSVWRARDASYVAGFLFATRRATDWTCLSEIQAPNTNSHSLAFQGRPHGEALP